MAGTLATNIVNPDPDMIRRAQNAFGIHLLTELAAETPRENVFISPTGIFMGLLLAELGASGETSAAIRRTLYVPVEVGSHHLRQSAASLVRLLCASDGFRISFVNAVWADRRRQLNPDYVANVRDLGAEANTLDFSDPAATEWINAWARKASMNLLTDIVSREILAATDCLITNALCFAHRWQDEFNSGDTQDRVFFRADGSSKVLPFIRRRKDRGMYRTGPLYEGAVIPYRRGARDQGEFGILLPSPGTTPEELLAGLDVRNFFEGRSHNVALDFRMPKFAVSCRARLKTALSRMGMELAFRYPGADFTSMRSPEFMGSPGFVLGDILHQSRLGLDEEGTVAAAETIVRVLVGAARPREFEHRELVIDRPFALLIRDIESTILFAGVVYDPEPLGTETPASLLD